MLTTKQENNQTWKESFFLINMFRSSPRGLEQSQFWPDQDWIGLQFFLILADQAWIELRKLLLL